MFILRQISEISESNINLGNSYNVITEANQPEQFKSIKKTLKDDEIHNICAYVDRETGPIVKVFSNETTYIMTESGKTFARIV